MGPAFCAILARPLLLAPQEVQTAPRFWADGLLAANIGDGPDALQACVGTAVGDHATARLLVQ
eukprot:6393067-Alexandrium_andersonii.AAC.1